jgi:amicoumacin kinase
MKRVPKPVMEDLCGRYGVDPEAIEFLGGGEDWSDGVLYSFSPRSGGETSRSGGETSRSGGETSRSGDAAPMVIKFLAFPSSDGDAIRRSRDRVAFVRYFGEKGSRVIKPEPSLGGKLEEIVEADGIAHLAYVYKKAKGRVVDKSDPSTRSGAFYRAMGATIGQLHASWEARPETLKSDGTSDQSEALKGWRDEWAFFLGWCHDDEVKLAWIHLKDALAKLPVDKSTYGFVHNDAHAWNLIFDPETESARSGGEPEFTLIDFDVANYHFFLSDAANALYSIVIMGSGGPEAGSPPPGFVDWAFAHFWEGYKRFREPENRDPELLDLFLQYRRCLMFMPFQEQTAKNPAWRERWKGHILSEDAKLFG